MLITLLLFFLSFLSMYYVFKIRGETRFSSLREYRRKGWPISSPINCLLYCFTRKEARRPIINVEMFPELNLIKENWLAIRSEGLKLIEKGYLEQVADPANRAYYDVGFRTFYKYGWRKFYLKWYGYTHNSAKKYCPITSEIISKIPSVKGAMFTVLAPGGRLTRHLDPFASSLRYHIGLKTPNSEKCFINVDGTSYAWRDGEPFLFDETYLHYVENNTDQVRFILMCDVARPVHTLGRLVNGLLAMFLSVSIVPNTPEDKKGLLNIIFYTLSPLTRASRALKNNHRKIYDFIKSTLTLVVISFLLFLFVLSVIHRL